MKVSVQEDETGQSEVKVSGSGTMEHKEEQPAPPMEASTPKRSEFAAVVFDQTAETYPVDANIECCYTLTVDITPSARDWVGVFKVGWLSPRDYLYYEWAPVAANYEAGKESQAKIIFQADRLPKDDGEFYQFCYVSSESNIRGASTPFQFKRPSADDYVELEDSDSEMLVIRPKTAFLEEEVMKYRKLVQSMETEREGLIEKLRKARNRADTCSHEATQLRSKYEELTCAMKDMSMAHDEVKSRLEMFEKERERLDDQVLREEQKVKECLDIIRALESERDELAGLNANLKTEVTTYRNSIVDLETQLRGVTMQLQQTEDQLHATHEMKKIMEDELVAYKLSQDKLSRDLESTYGQNHALKEQLQLMEVGFAEELKVMRAEDQNRDADFEALRKKLELTQQENFVLMKQLDVAEKDTFVSQEAAASLFALQKANDALKSRHDKMSTALKEKEKELMSLTRQSRHKEKELKREAEDWKQRVEMCRAEYKTLFAENTKLRHRLGKYRSNDEVLSVSALQEEKATETVPAITKTVACQKAVKVVHSSSGDAIFSTTTDAATDTDSSCSNMEALATELETGQHKNDRYKRLYLEEKERGDMLRSHYYEELQKRAAEIDEIKKEAAKKDGLQQQMQYYLEKLERQIARMTWSGNDYYEDHVEDSYPADWNPDSQDGTAEYPGASEVEAHRVRLVHGNPYHQQEQVYIRPTTEEYEQSESEGRSSNREEEGACGGLENDMQNLELDGEPSHTEEPTLVGQIRQLPPPLQPEILPGARLAAIRQQCGYPSPPANDNADDQLFEDCSGYAGAMPSAPAPLEYPEENERKSGDARFMDAIGEGMKICPVCEMHIATMSDADFAEHIVMHFGRLCPVCKIQADDSMDAKVFEEHVNKCCESKRHGKNQ